MTHIKHDSESSINDDIQNMAGVSRVQLTKGYVSIVDADCQIASGRKWTASVNRNGRVYALRTTIESGRKRHSFLHREIVGAKNGEHVDHINGNTLDNRRVNLRICTPQQNTFNQRKSRGLHRYKGVHWMERLQKYTARITYNGRNLYLGLFITEEDAARAYDAKARELFKEFAKPNFNKPDATNFASAEENGQDVSNR